MSEPRYELGLCWATLGDVSLVDLIRVAGATGYVAITATPSHYIAARQEGHSDDDLRRRLDDQGLRVTQIDPLISGLPGLPRLSEVPTWARSFFEATEEDCYRAAQALGAASINVAHVLGAPVPLGQMAEVIAGIAERAAARSLRLSIEFFPYSDAVSDLPTAVRLVAAAGCQNVGVCLDTHHFFRSGGELQDLAGLPPGAIESLQVSDLPANAKGERAAPGGDRLMPGDGAIPLRAILARVLRASPGLNVGVEVPSDAYVGWTPRWSRDEPPMRRGRFSQRAEVGTGNAAVV